MSTERDATTLFIERWQGVTASELSTSQSFVIALCDLLGVPRPHATAAQDYMFERPVTFRHGDGSSSAGRIDCYRHGAFIWESKKLKVSPLAAATGHTPKAFDDALMRARAQAESYARALPAAEGRPPFLVVVDVGHVIELYAEFSRSGATYTPFPDPRSHRIALKDLHDERIRARLRALWLDPQALDPARASAQVTREVAAELALLATSLEAAGPHGQHPPQAVAAFLTRCLFSMFAEDVGLLPERSFKELLERHRDEPATLHKMLRVLWADMDRGGFSAALARDVLKFNGKLFKGAAVDGYVLPLQRDQIDGLLRAAQANWREVEPAIFGTLLERALAPEERHALGAHYTPRAYVERLVLPTVVQPLRDDWANAQAAALLLANEGKLSEARDEIKRFHHQLCSTRVLDPACGSGNFLYVTLEHLKRLEGEVLNQLQMYGLDTDQVRQDKLGFAGETVTLQQLLGIEINERAAALAELVLWIGFLQWHIRTLGNASVAEPVVHDYGNIECRDAVLAYDRIDPVRDAQGRPVTRWDGVHFKPHPVTGEDVPDEAFRVVLETYTNPRKAVWPAVDFIVGNPPFIGKLKMREALGDGYVEALRSVHEVVPDSADFVMYWWQQAAAATVLNAARRFGFITTNSITMIYNRRVVEYYLQAKQPLRLLFAIADHPWVDNTQGAAVRIAMTVGGAGAGSGRLLRVVREGAWVNDEVEIDLAAQEGSINADLSIGANFGLTKRLGANAGMSHMGVILVGAGFVVEPGDPLLELEPDAIKPYLNGRDLSQTPRGVSVIDLAGLGQDEVLRRYPNCYQRLLLRVKPERDASKDEYLRENWWLFRRTNHQLRSAIAGLKRYIGTTETAKHRVFSFISGNVLPDQKIRVVTLDDAFYLGVLSSRVHVLWALANGGRLGKGNDPVYNNTACFEPFAFPNLAAHPDQAKQLAATAEELDAHRKRQQAAHATLTLTDMYNVLDALRLGRVLSAKEKLTHTNGLVSVLAELHDRIDTLVLQAYGWADLAPALVGQAGGTLPWPEKPAALAAAEEEVLQRLVALNAERAAEEARGEVRWLRPEFQDPARRAASAATQLPTPVQEEIEQEAQPTPSTTPPAATRSTASTPKAGRKAAAASGRRPWPATLPEQVRAVADALAAAPGALDEALLAEAFTGRGPWKKRLPGILLTLEALGRARREGARWRA